MGSSNSWREIVFSKEALGISTRETSNSSCKPPPKENQANFNFSMDFVPPNNLYGLKQGDLWHEKRLELSIRDDITWQNTLLNDTCFVQHDTPKKTSRVPWLFRQPRQVNESIIESCKIRTPMKRAMWMTMDFKRIVSRNDFPSSNQKHCGWKRLLLVAWQAVWLLSPHHSWMAWKILKFDFRQPKLLHHLMILAKL